MVSTAGSWPLGWATQSDREAFNPALAEQLMQTWENPWAGLRAYPEGGGMPHFGLHHSWSRICSNYFSATSHCQIPSYYPMDGCTDMWRNRTVNPTVHLGSWNPFLLSWLHVLQSQSWGWLLALWVCNSVHNCLPVHSYTLDFYSRELLPCFPLPLNSRLCFCSPAVIPFHTVPGWPAIHLRVQVYFFILNLSPSIQYYVGLHLNNQPNQMFLIQMPLVVRKLLLCNYKDHRAAIDIWQKATTAEDHLFQDSALGICSEYSMSSVVGVELQWVHKKDYTGIGNIHACSHICMRRERERCNRDKIQVYLYFNARSLKSNYNCRYWNNSNNSTGYHYLGCKTKGKQSQNCTGVGVIL